MTTALKNILLFLLLPIKSFLKVIKSLFGWLFRLGTIEISVVLLYNLYQHTINPKINEEEDISHEGVDLPCFKRKLTNSYLCARLMKQDESKEAVEMDKALNAVLNAVREIGDPKTIEAINHCSSEEAGNLWYRIYREMFSTDLGGM